MPITATDIKYYKSSSGVGLGGPISASEIVSGVLNNIFDNVSSVEATDGDVEYRCIYVKNTHVSLVLQAARVFIEYNTSSPDTDLEIGLDPAGINGTAVVVVSEGIAPVGVSFSNPVDFANGLVIGDITANGGYQAIWLKRTVNAGASALASDSATLRVQGETSA